MGEPNPLLIGDDHEQCLGAQANRLSPSLDPDHVIGQNAANQIRISGHRSGNGQGPLFELPLHVALQHQENRDRAGSHHHDQQADQAQKGLGSQGQCSARHLLRVGAELRESTVSKRRKTSRKRSVHASVTRLQSPCVTSYRSSHARYRLHHHGNT